MRKHILSRKKNNYLRWFGLDFRAMFGNGLYLKKWIGIVVNLIDVKKKVRIFCIKKMKFFVLY
jgi:hypothetical protein